MLKYASFTPFLFTLLLAACGSTGTGGAPALPTQLPATGLFLRSSGSSPGGLIVVLNQAASTCSDLGQNVKRKGETLVALSFAASNPNGTVPATLSPGVYPVLDNGTFAALPTGTQGMAFGLSQYDNTCTALEKFADSGSASLIQVDHGTVAGSYDVTLAGLHYTGVFTSAFCDPTASTDTGNATPQCE